MSRNPDCFTVAPDLDLRLRAQLRKAGFDPSRLEKRAETGSDLETNFEQTFASMGFIYIKDRAPQLIDNMVGFQLLDRDEEDNSKAFGCFGFKIGKEMLFIPMIFRMGHVTGHEMVWIQSRDLLVPTKQGWIDAIMSRTPRLLGEESKKDVFQQGGLVPDMRSMVHGAPGAVQGRYKSAGVKEPVFRIMTSEETLPFVHMVAKVARTNPYRHKKACTDFREVLRTDPNLAWAATDLALRMPLWKQALEKLYGPDLFTNALVAAKQKLAADAHDLTSPRVPRKVTAKYLVDGEPKQASVRDPGLTIFLTDESGHAPAGTGDLPQADYLRLLDQGYLIHDKRAAEETSLHYTVKYTDRMTSPSRTGIMEVLSRKREWDECLVCYYPWGLFGPHPRTVVVPWSGDGKSKGRRPWVCGPAAVWTNDLHPGKPNDFTAWAKDLPSSLPDEDNYDKTYIGVLPDGTTTLPFRVVEKLEDFLYRIDMVTDMRQEGMLPTLRESSPHWSTPPYNDGCYCLSAGQLHIHKDEGTRVRTTGVNHHDRTLHVPGEMKFFPCQGRYGSEDESWNPATDPTESAPLGDKKVLEVKENEKVASLKIGGDSASGWVQYANELERVPGDRMVPWLVYRYGFTEKVAIELWETHRKRTGDVPVVFGEGFPLRRIQHSKSAGPFLHEQDVTAPRGSPPPYGSEVTRGGGVLTTSSQSEELPVETMSAANTDPHIYDPMRPIEPEVKQMAEEASNNGTKELMDVGGLMALLRSINSPELVDRFLGDLILGMDRTGRLLLHFNYRYHTEKERYGDDDLPEIIATLRTLFNTGGEVILKLRQKEIGRDLDELNQIDLNDASDN